MASSPWSIAGVAFLVRLAYLCLGHPWRFAPGEQHFHFGWEMGRIAAALASGRGYADAFFIGSGVTAWEPPLYPWMVAGVFRLFGVYSALSGFVVLALNSVANCLVIPALWSIARNSYGLRTARWAAWSWALYPAAMQYAVRWVWEMSLSACLLTAVLLVTLRLGEAQNSPARRNAGLWACFGALWGLLALSNPALGTVLPVCGAWLYRRGLRPICVWLRIALATALCAACILPWIVQRSATLHHFIPLRDNFGAELWAGNGPGSDGFRAGNLVLTAAAAPEARSYVRLGEWQWVHLRGQAAAAYLQQHPGHLVRLCFKRMDFQWFGIPQPDSRHPFGQALQSLNYGFFSVTGWLGLLLSVRRSIPGAGLFLGVFLVQPLFCYLVSAGPGFRHPLEPLIALFTVFLFQSAEPHA